MLKGAGCGKALPAAQPVHGPSLPFGYLQYTVMGTGKTLGADQPAKVGPRTFWVRVPADYDPNTAYRVVYIGQGCQSGSAPTNSFQLYKGPSGTDEAIYVALDVPTDNANLNCYDTRDGPTSQEWEAFELFHTVVDTNYCVDNDRVYVAGYSTGAWLANQWGCYFAGDGQTPASAPATPRRFAPRYHIRGQAAVSGGEPNNNPPCNGPVAAIWIHGLWEIGNPIAGDEAALARVLTMNNCVGSPKAQWHAEVWGLDVCEQYTSCPLDYPVVFCRTNNVSESSNDSIRAIPAFKLFFDQLNPLP